MKPNLDGLILTQSAQNSLKASGSSRARTRMDTDQEKEHRVDWAVKLQSLFKKKKSFGSFVIRSNGHLHSLNLEALLTAWEKQMNELWAASGSNQNCRNIKT